MKNLWVWIVGTIRPIALLAWIPVLLGAIASKTSPHGDIIYAMSAAILGVGFANSFNSVIDRYIDRLNPKKATLAKLHPVAAWYGVLYMLPPLAFCLRSNAYNHLLFAMLYYLSFAYSYTFGRVRVLKRVIVAGCIALLFFLYARTYNPALWFIAGASFLYFFYREFRKDQDDRVEDDALRFPWERRGNFDIWCLGASPLAIALYLLSLLMGSYRMDMAESVISFGLVISVWSYILIRYRYGHYRMALIHQTSGGRLGAIVALVGLMPSFVNPLFVLLVLVNIVTILCRSYLSKSFAFRRIAILHDSYLWASLPLLAMTKTGFSLHQLLFSLFIGVTTYALQSRRLGRISTATSPV